MKKNCWDFKGCQRGPGGSLAEEKGACPAALEKRLDGVHGGLNAGRACWMVASTLCDGKEQGKFARKFDDCLRCGFYNLVKAEEGNDYQMSIILLGKLNPFK